MYVHINCFFMNWETSNGSKSLVAFNSLCYNFAPGLRKTPFRLQLPLSFCIFWIEVIRSMAIAWDQTSLILLCWCAVIMDIQIKKLHENFLFFEIKTYRNLKILFLNPWPVKQLAQLSWSLFLFLFTFSLSKDLHRIQIELEHVWNFAMHTFSFWFSCKPTLWG